MNLLVPDRMSQLAVIVVDGGQCAITTHGAIRAECEGLQRWSQREGYAVAGSMANHAAAGR